MDSDSLSSAPRSDTNIANIGAGAQLKQFAQGSNITQIEGYTAEQVRVLIADIRASYQPKPFDGKSPYVGLASFQEQDADRFFGREKLTQEIVARIEIARFLVIAGPSGSGKSSLARAGLIPALKKGALAGSENWLYEILAPGRNPLTELARVISSFTVKLQAGDEIVKRGRGDETLLHRWTNIALGDQKMRRAILLVDQFEEVFTQGTDESERAAFLNLLVYAATIENGRVTIVCCTRSDFIGNWVKSPNLNDLLRHGLYQIPPMQPDELVSAIARPAIQVGLPIDETLVKEILDDMRASPGALPLMQFALQDLFEYEKNQGGVIALTRDDYKERGGLHQALSRHADAAFAKLNAAEQKIARSIFASLIEPGRGNVDTKRTARLQEIVPADTDAVQVKSVITKLADARLVTTDKKDADETITLAHERLIDAWKWLRDLIDENRAAIALQNQINDDAKEWEQQGHDASYLYTGARLATAQEEVEKKQIELSAAGREFVSAGVKAKEDARKIEETRTWRLIMGVGAAAVVFAVLAIIAFVFQQQAEARRNEAEHQQRIARSRELAALALSQFDVNPERAILIGIEANKVQNESTFESEDALRQLLSEYPLDSVLRGHQSVVNSAQFSPDGRVIATASSDNTTRLWDADSSGLIAVLDGHAREVWSAQFSPDGTKIVTTSSDQTARTWDATSGKELFVLRGHEGEIWYAEFSPDGTKIVTASSDQTARTWDATSGKELFVLRGHENLVENALFSPDGNKIATASRDGTARIWETSSAKEIAVLRGHNDYVESVQFSPDGTKIVTAGSDDTARVWNATSGKELFILRGHESVVGNAQFSPNGLRVITASWDNSARTWEVAGGRELAILQGHEMQVWRANFSPDGSMIATASEDKTARVWESTKGKEIGVLRGHSDVVNDVSFSQDNKMLVTASSDKTARIWDVKTGKEIAILRGHQAEVWHSQFSPDGNLIVTASSDNTARIWNNSGVELAVLRGHDSIVNKANFSPNGTWIVTASRDGTARIWESSTGKELAVLRSQHGGMWQAQFSPDGKLIMTAGEDGTIRIWAVTDGKQLANLRGHNRDVFEARFSPDGTMVVTSGDDNTARVWSTMNWKELSILRGHIGGVSAQFSPDNKMIVTSSWDATARIWNAINGQELAILRGHSNVVNSAQFSPNGRIIVTSSIDRTARIYLVNVTDLIELAKKRVGRELTCEERVQYMREVIACHTPTPSPTP